MVYATNRFTKDLLTKRLEDVWPLLVGKQGSHDLKTFNGINQTSLAVNAPSCTKDIFLDTT